MCVHACIKYKIAHIAILVHEYIDYVCVCVSYVLYLDLHFVLANN